MNHFKISVTALACAAVLAACGGSDDGPAAPTLSVLSSKPEFVSGGDALVEVALPPG
ncbi:MAG: hypothetical protein JWP52_1844, partial [Rhizobacter sp.]|nr:hypothetical protein [Rhizobacter sp.]